LFAKPSEVIYSTESALKKRKQELQHMLDVEIPANKKDIGRAREFGDLSENFEYNAAKERQHKLYHKLRTMQTELAKVVVIGASPIDTARVTIGAKITLRNVQSGRTLTYTVLGRWDTDLTKNIISNESPLGAVLLQKMKGDRVTIDNDGYEIISIEKGL
jgi:transcription elongation factor GreA